MARHLQRTTDNTQQQREPESPTSLLPEGCIAAVITCTTPRDACRLSLVSSIFKSAAESDAVWERFLPLEYQSIISKSSPCPSSSSSPSSLLCLPSKKELFLSLCDHPILIDDGKKAFFLDKRSGKKCYMISARDLMIAWGDTPEYWTWTSLPGARFQEVAELIDVCWLEIRGKISTCILSPGTDYTAYLVFKLTAESYGFKGLAVEVHIGLVGSESQKRSVYLDAVRGQRMQYQFGRRAGLFNRSGSLGWQASSPRQNDGHHPEERGDRWLEVELGDFYNAGVEDGVLDMRIWETKRLHWKRGLVVQGIEIRPKQVE